MSSRLREDIQKDYQRLMQRGAELQYTLHTLAKDLSKVNEELELVHLEFAKLPKEEVES